MTGPDLHCNQAAARFESLEDVDVTGLMHQKQALGSRRRSAELGRHAGCLVIARPIDANLPRTMREVEPELATHVR